MVDLDNSSDNPVIKEILSVFPKLYSNDVKTRLSTASHLLEIITKDKDQSLDEVFFSVVERLIKGTTRSKDAPKIGSTVLLTEILHTFKNFKISKLLEMSKKIIGDVNDELKVEGVTGWTLIFTSIVQSNRLDISDKKTLKELIRFMVQLGDKKPLSNIAICNIFEMLFGHQFDSDAFSSILKSSLKLNEHGNASPFHLYLILLIHKHPELSRVLDHIPTVDLDDPENLTKYVEASVLYYPSIHPACIELFRYIDENNRMEVFWKPVFNDATFGNHESYKFHRFGLSFLSTILPYLNETNVGHIFSKPMMDLWMQGLTSRVCRLHATAVQLSKDLVINYDSYDASLQETIISLLTESPGTVSFDEITQTRTVTQLYVKTKAEAVQSLVDRTIEKIRNYKAQSARDKMRSLFVGQLRDLVKSIYIADSPEIKLTVLNFFLAHGYFDVSNEETLNLVTPATDSLIAKIQSLFFKLISTTCSNNPDVMEGVGLYALQLIKGGVPLKDDKTGQLWKKMKKMKIKFKKLKVDGQNEKQLSIFKPLLYGIAISSLQDSNDIEALIANFDELVECFKRSLSDSHEENEPKWPDVLLDLMISQFPAQSPFLSSVMVKAFRLIVADVTLEGLEQLKIALLADKLDEDEDGEDEEEDEDEDVGGNDMESENIKKLDEESEGEESDVPEDDEEDVDDEFRAKVTMALGPAAATGDETEAAIDDEEMFQLDEALSEAFRSKYSNDRHTQATLKILRSKCLDLVEIIFKSKEQSLERIMFLIPVLIDAIKLYGGSKEVELRARVSKLFMLLPNFKSFSSFDAVNPKVAQALFKKGIDMASKMDNTYIQASAAKICVWIMTLSKHININTDWAFDHLLKLLQEYFSKPNSFVSKEFFMIIFQNHKIFNSQILEALSKSVFVNLRPFKKLGGLSLINTYLRLCSNDIVKDKSIEVLLHSIKKDAITGLTSAISSKRSALTQEYRRLISTLGKFIHIEKDEIMQRKENEKKKEKKEKFKKGKKTQDEKIVQDQEEDEEEKEDEDEEEEEKAAENEKEQEKEDEDEESEKEEKSEDEEKEKEKEKLEDAVEENETEEKKEKENDEEMETEKEPEKKEDEEVKKKEEEKMEEEEAETEKTEEKEDQEDQQEQKEQEIEIEMEEVKEKEEEEEDEKVNVEKSEKPETEEIKKAEEEKKDDTETEKVEENNLEKVKVEEETKESSKENEKESIDLPSPKKLKVSSNTSSPRTPKNAAKPFDKTPPFSPKPSTSTSTESFSSSKKSKNVFPLTPNSATKMDEHVAKLNSLKINQEEEQPVVKRIKFEPQSESEEESNPVPRLTRSRVQTPRVIKKSIKPEPETFDEQLEADDDLPDFSIPRVQMIKTPSTRSRTRSTTPTKETPTTPALTPLRRSLRTRK